ncbi:hypothetical protein SAMN02745831_07234 [Streptomyces sp. PgraA7]|nr:hypothetical protein SAMN02745831_07234 [Streptomyces sp. PgraA7]
MPSRYAFRGAVASRSGANGSGGGAGFARLRACVVTLNLGGVLALAALLFGPAEETWAAAYALGGSGVIAWACRDSRFSWLWARAD